MSFENVQNQFMAHIRNPQKVPSVGNIEDRRLKIYRELFFNNIKGFLNTGFPVLESIVESEVWEKLARQFFISHDCRSPYFVDISKEFVEYLANELNPEDYPFPFAAELAHYEWLELDVSVRKSESFLWWDEADYVSTFSFSPVAELVSYSWPVHQISPDFKPVTPLDEANFFVVYRNKSFEVTFSQINQVTAHLLNCVIELECTDLKTLTEVMINALPQLPEAQVEQATLDIVMQMLRSQIFVTSQ